MRKLIGITGGIGAGKSVVCKVLGSMDYPVYDCDSRAKALMDSSDAIKDAIRSSISAIAIGEEGRIDRKALSKIVFSDHNKLATLNAIVHAAVREDIAQWIETQQSEFVFIESAILHTGGLDAIVDEAWVVEAPLDVRIERVMKRSRLSEEEVMCRIAAQQREIESLLCPIRTIDNSPQKSLLCQINKIISR